MAICTVSDTGFLFADDGNQSSEADHDLLNQAKGRRRYAREGGENANAGPCGGFTEAVNEVFFHGVLSFLNQ